MKPWTSYTVAELRAMIEENRINQDGPNGRPVGCQDCLRFIAAGVRGNGGFPNGGLNVPESIQFFVGPPACGRHADFGLMPTGRNPRLFRIRLSEADLVNGTGPMKVQKKICEFVEAMEQKPKVVSICTTCVDGLLHTNYSKVGKALEEKFGIRFLIVKMFPFTAKSARTHSEMLIQTQYSVLKPSGEKKKSVNIIGRIDMWDKGSEFNRELEKNGYTVNTILECNNLEEYDAMGDACLNIVVVKYALYAAKYMEKEYGIPYITFLETCSPDEMRENYRKLEEVLGCKLDVEEDWKRVHKKAKELSEKYKDSYITIGNAYDYESLKLAMDLCGIGVPIKKIFVNEVHKSDLPYLQWLEKHCPDIPVYVTSEPELLGYVYNPERTDLSIGLDPSMTLRYPGAVRMNAPEQPFEFRGLELFLEQIDQSLAPKEVKSTGNVQTEPNPFARNWSMYRKELR